MTAEREGLAEIAGVLAEHDGVSFDLGTPRQYTQHGGWNIACACGSHICSHVADDECDCHRAHLADALADLLAAWDRRVRAEAVMQAEGDIRDYRAAYSRCVDLVEEWEQAAERPMPKRAKGESAQDQGVRIGVWHSVQTAARELRAAIEADA